VPDDLPEPSLHAALHAAVQPLHALHAASA
jgi:hypothetical protein